MKIGICLIIKDQNEDLPEWLSHYRLVGVDKFFIFDNNSQHPIFPSEDVEIIKWVSEEKGSQIKAYNECCNIAGDFDYIGFFDTDEFYISKSMNIKFDIETLKSKYGEFDGLGVYWRFYGNNPAKYKSEKINSYYQYSLSNHIKSIVNPKAVSEFINPHFVKLKEGSKQYIDELGKTVESAINNHSSETFFLKHLFTRSVEDWEKKVARGSANKKEITRTIEEFYVNTNLLNINEFDNKKKTFIQIGTNKGQDDFKKLVYSYKEEEVEKLILVEPLERFNTLVKEQYKQYTPIIINKAIVDNKDEPTVTFYVNERYINLSSLSKNHILKHQVEGEIKEFKIATTTLNDIFEDYHIRKIDVLWIDTEGYDDKLIYSIDFDRYNIKEIYFEYVHIDSSKLEQFLKNLGYNIESGITPDNLTKKARRL